MKLLCTGCPTFVAAFGVMLAVASPTFGQFEPNFREPLTEAAETECAALRTASIDDLNKEERWLTSLMGDADGKAKQKAQEFVDLVLRYRRGSRYERPELRKPTEDAYQVAKEALFEMEVLEVFNEIVRVCISDQRRMLQKERRLRGKYLAHCTAARHSIPESIGHLDLELFSDNSLKVTISEQGESVQVFGKMYATRDFLASSKDGQEAMIHVDGKFETFDPLSGSGEIWWWREAQGYGRLECKGRWVSQ